MRPIAHGTCTFAIPLAAVGVRAVFNHFQLVFGGDAEDFVHVGKTHAEVNGQDGFRFRGDSFFNELGVEAIGVGIDVNENGNGVEQKDGTDGAFPSVSGSDHFVAGTNVDGFQSGLNRDGPGVDRLRVFCGVNFSKFFGEGGGMFAGKRLAAPSGAGENILSASASALVEMGQAVKGVLRRGSPPVIASFPTRVLRFPLS